MIRTYIGAASSLAAAILILAACARQETPDRSVERVPVTISVETSPGPALSPDVTENPGRFTADRPREATGSLEIVPDSSIEVSTVGLLRFDAPAYTATRSILAAPARGDEGGPLVEVKSRPMGSGNTLAGVDVLKRDDFAALKGRKIALLTNTSAIDRDGTHLLDLVHGKPGIEITAIFVPEHGLLADLDTHVPDQKHERTGLMVYSLYSREAAQRAKPNRPLPEHLAGTDLVIVDMQDIGARYYTYMTYMAYMMDACAPLDIEVMVLDRPNPIGGLYVDGPLPDEDQLGRLTCYFPMPIAHGMTLGELARLFNAENKIGCKLTVVEMENWTRNLYYDQTGLLWVNPSPNIQNLEGALVYPGIAVTEALVSMGRGTDEPFQIFGTPYLEDPEEMIREVTKDGLAGVRLEAVDFTPTGTLARAHPGEGQLCRGARIVILDRPSFRPYELGLRVMHYLQRKYGFECAPETRWDAAAGKRVETGRQLPKYDVLRVRGPASSMVCARLREQSPVADTLAVVDAQVARFKEMRAKYLIYPEGTPVAVP